MSLKDFTIIKKLGQGSYATVYQVRRATDQKLYALKQIDVGRLDSKSKQNALNQIRFLASFNCKNIIKYYEAFFEEQLSLLCIVMQFADEGDLGHLIQVKKQKKEKFFEIQIWKALIALIHGIGYLHDRSILHRDIKPENIFIENGNFKIGDLNVSKLAEQNRKGNFTQIGTPFYASPEIWENCPYDNKCDVWSLGCVIYQMATLSPPFLAKSMDTLYEQIMSGKVRPIPKHYSNELEAIITRCLQKQTRKRPTIKQLQENFTVQMYSNLYYSTKELEVEKQKFAPLLKTITMGKGKGMAEVQLPQPNYGDQKQNSSDCILSSRADQKCSDQIQQYAHDNLFQESNRKTHSQSVAEISSPLTQRKDFNNQRSSAKILQSFQKIQNRRSLPRTELSAKKLQTLEQISNAIQKPNPLKPKVSQPTLFTQNNQNVVDYKKMICSKLPSKMGIANIRQAELGKIGKKTIIQQLVSLQQGSSKKKTKPQGRYRPQIFVNPELENAINMSYLSIGKRLGSVQSSLQQ